MSVLDHLKNLQKCDLTRVPWQDSLYYSLQGGNVQRKMKSEMIWNDLPEQRCGEVRETFPLAHKVQNEPPCSLKSFSEKSLGAARSSPSPRLGQWFMAKGLYMFMAKGLQVHT